MTSTQPLLLRNAKLVGFGAERRSDVLIGADGRIAAVGPALAAQAGAETLDLAGAFLSPGWTDLHTHV